MKRVLLFIAASLFALSACAGFQKWLDDVDPRACQPGDPNYDPKTDTCKCEHPGIDCTMPTSPCDSTLFSPCPGRFGASKDGGTDGARD